MADDGLTHGMVDKPEAPLPLTLKRWSQRKRDVARSAAGPVSLTPVAPAAIPAAMPQAAPAVPDAAATASHEPVPLPPVESLDFESDYAAFMQPKVNEETKRAALKKLFSDPSFNVMDGLDIYVGDYTQPDPMPAGMLEKISAVYAILDPTAPPPDAKPTVDEPVAAFDTAPIPTPATSAEITTESPRAADAPSADAEKPA